MLRVARAIACATRSRLLVAGSTTENRQRRSWSRAHLRHIFRLFRYGKYPAITVYESLGEDVFGAFEPGWLNLGLWEGLGDQNEAHIAPRRMVERVCEGIESGGNVLDVGNGLGAQDLVIDELLQPEHLFAVNLSQFQLRAGRDILAQARATPIAADATRLPIASRSMHAIISVEAAFHFSSRAAFFAEARRVLRDGGKISMSDIVVQRPPRGCVELLAGIWTMRFWGLRRSAIATAEDVAEELMHAGFSKVDVHRCGSNVIDPALRVIGERIRARTDAPRLQRWGARAMVAQWHFLRRRGILDYILVSATAETDRNDVSVQPTCHVTRPVRGL